jgi:hypothetical protein
MPSDSSSEVGLNPQTPGTLAVVAHGNAIAGEVRHASLGKVGDGEADFFIHALVERLVLAEAVTGALAVGDEFLEDLVHVRG